MDYKMLREHIGHKVVCVCYGGDNEPPINIAIECETCGSVLFDLCGGDTYEKHLFDPTKTALECQDCGHICREDDLERAWPDIPGLGERVAPGEPCPAGECPECGALMHLMEEKEGDALGDKTETDGEA